jgi:hypothetical protein
LQSVAGEEESGAAFLMNMAAANPNVKLIAFNYALNTRIKYFHVYKQTNL